MLSTHSSSRGIAHLQIDTRALVKVSSMWSGRLRRASILIREARGAISQSTRAMPRLWCRRFLKRQAGTDPLGSRKIRLMARFSAW
jgi:hypothetical protein